MSKALRVGILCLALAPSAYLAWTARDMPHFGQFHDDSIYWVCAKSLAEGSGYRILSLPEQPHQTKYPPLYPLLLAGIWKLSPDFPDNLRLATVLCWVSLPVFLALCGLALRDLGLDGTHRLVVLVLLALCPYTVLYSMSLMSELPFACLLLGSFLLAKRAEDGGRKRWMAAAGGAFGGAAYLMRNAALPLLGTVPLYFLLRNRRREAGLFLGAMLPAVVGWNLWVQSHAPGSSDPASLYYTSYLGYHLASFTWTDVPILIWTNLVGMLEGAGSLVVPQSAGYVAVILGLAAGAGVVRIATRGGVRHFPWFAAGYLLLLLPWHLGLRDRYMRLMLPLAPLVLAGFTEEFGRLARRARAWLRAEDARQMVLGGLLAAGVGGLALWGAAALGATLGQFPGFLGRARQGRAAHQAAYQWIRAHLRADAAFLAGADPVLYLYTGRRSRRLVVGPRLLYRGEWGEVSRQYREAASYARARGLGYLYLDVKGAPSPAGGDLSAESVDLGAPGMRVVYESPEVVICALREDAGMTGREQAHEVELARGKR